MRLRGGNLLLPVVVGVALVLVGGVVTGLADAAETDGITATYETTGVWEGGQAGVYTITNTGEDIVEDWVLSFSLPGGTGVASLWNGVLRISGTTHTVTPQGWNGVLGPGAGTAIGFTLASVDEIIPGDCLVDDHECAGQDLLPGRNESGRRPAMVASALARGNPETEPGVPPARHGREGRGQGKDRGKGAARGRSHARPGRPAPGIGAHGERRAPGAPLRDGRHAPTTHRGHGRAPVLASFFLRRSAAGAPSP